MEAGPYWARKDAGAWTIFKGEIEPGESRLRQPSVRRGGDGPVIEGALLPLGAIRQAGGKLVHAFAAEADIDPSAVRSNSFEIEWPPRSGRRQSLSRDRPGRLARPRRGTTKLVKGQAAFLDRLAAALAGAG